MRCNRFGQIVEWVPDPSSPEVSSETEFNGWWFIIGAVISSIFILPVEQLSAMYKGGAILFCGGIIGVWQKQIFGLIICAVILFCAWVYIATKI